MKLGLTAWVLALLLSGCGAQVDGHTGGKTNWLSACNEDGDCRDLVDAVCEAKLCTQKCESDCSIDRTSCVTVWTDAELSDQITRACLPQCERDAECATFGSSYNCESNVCILDGLVESPPETSTLDAATHFLNPVRDLSGIVLLDTGDDGDDAPLEDPNDVTSFSARGFWYTYDDSRFCMADGDPNLDPIFSLEPPSDEGFAPTAYSVLGLAPPPEVLASAPDNTHGIYVTGTGHEYFGGGVAFKFTAAYNKEDRPHIDNNPGIDLQAAGYTGIRFWVYAPIEMALLVKLHDAYSTPEAGLCQARGPYPYCRGDEHCLNAPSSYDSEGGASSNILAGPTWRLYELYFASVNDDPTTEAFERGPLKRADWWGNDVEGNPIKDILATPNHIYQLQFQTVMAEGDETFAFIIDNVGFIEANGAEDNANGRFAPE